MRMINESKAGLVYTFTAIRKDGSIKWVEKVHNLLPDESVAYILGAALNGGAQFSTWYIGITENSYTPLTTNTMTNAVNDAGESVAYAGTSRPTLSPDAISGGVFANTSSPTRIEFTASATIQGGFITSNITRGNTAGLLLSIVALGSAKTMDAGEVLEVTAGMSLTTI